MKKCIVCLLFSIIFLLALSAEQRTALVIGNLESPHIMITDMKDYKKPALTREKGSIFNLLGISGIWYTPPHKASFEISGGIKKLACRS